LLTLETYLREHIHRDREEIAAIERVLLETGKTIDQNYDGTTWPYEIHRDGDRTPKVAYSQSTTAMMIRAIDLLLDAAPGPRSPYPFDVGSLKTELKVKRDNAFTNLLDQIVKSDSDKEKSGKNAIRTWSGTYGTNDPLTLSFLSEINLITHKDKDKIDHHIFNRAKTLLSNDPIEKFADFFDYTTRPPKGKILQPSTPLSNAFVPLRVVRAYKSTNAYKSENKDLLEQHSKYLIYFESTLHDQLSYSVIPDSRFDPAELIFCLEGVLQLSKQSVDTRLFERVLEVLEAAQNTSAHWRPNKPFLRNERGLVLFPVSIEAANSLRWSCAELDKDERFHSYSERYITLFRRFWEWLEARRVTFGTGKSGWHSDHVADPNSIQLWDTAQVVGFLVGYRSSLLNHIARTTLRLSRFNVRKPKKANKPWDINTKTLQKQRNTVVSGNGESDKVQEEEYLGAEFEPVTTLGPEYKIYERIGAEFLEGWLKGAPRNYSMLLYGPPGTGKTSVAENLADALGFRLITITVSDFLAGGGGEVEARAKMIFDVLEAQADVVILFDEIDELVLDRGSERHDKQDTVFKFMTPGMLTKINNLRRAKRCIFVLATNYAYRIDPAIRRTGRIDQNYLLLPPDAVSRKKILQNFLKNSGISDSHVLHPGNLSEHWAELEKASFFLGYKDIEAVVSQVLNRDNGEATGAEELCRTLRTWGRTTTLRPYGEASKGEKVDRDALMGELYPLIEMIKRECEQPPKGTALESAVATANIYGPDQKPLSIDVLNENALTHMQNKSQGYERN